MTDLFLKVLNLSFSAAWVVLAVVLARLLLKKAPRRLVCALWALVALRLLFGGIEGPQGRGEVCGGCQAPCIAARWHRHAGP